MIGPLIQRFARDLRFPALFFVTAALFLADLLLPDLIPFVDEMLLALATVLLASLRRRSSAGPARPVAASADR